MVVNICHLVLFVNVSHGNVEALNSGKLDACLMFTFEVSFLCLLTNALLICWPCMPLQSGLPLFWLVCHPVSFLVFISKVMCGALEVLMDIVGYCRIACIDNHNKTHITLFSIVLWCSVICCLIVMNTVRWLGLASCSLFCMTVRTWVHSVFAWCRDEADGGTVWSAVAVGGEMHSIQVTGSAASTSPLLRCRGDVKCPTTLLPSELSPTILLLLVVADKFTAPDVQTTNYSLVYQSWLPLSWSVGTGYSFLTWAMIDAQLGKVACCIQISAVQPALTLVSWQIW